MKKIFFSHPDVILSAIALILLAILIGFFSWGINDVVSELHLATVPSAAPSAGGFDTQDAAKINFHGVSTSTAPAPVATPTPAPTTAAVTSTSSTTTPAIPSSLK